MIFHLGNWCISRLNAGSRFPPFEPKPLPFQTDGIETPPSSNVLSMTNQFTSHANLIYFACERLCTFSLSQLPYTLPP